MLTDENVVITVLSPRQSNEGSWAQFVGTNWRLAMLPNKPFTLKTFYSLKTNAVHSMTNCIRGILIEN